MEWLGLLLGMVFGAMSLGSGGIVIGAVVGWMAARDLARTARIKALEDEVGALRLAHDAAKKLRPLEGRLEATAARRTTDAPAGVAAVDAWPASSSAVFAASRVEADAAAVDAWPVSRAARSAASRLAESDQGAAVDAWPASSAAAFAPSRVPEPTADVPPTSAATEPPAARPDEPAEPLPADLDAEPDLVTRALRWMMAGNPAVKIGVVVLFIGMAFLLKYTAEYIALELRYLAVLGASAAAIGFGWRQRSARRVFAITLQGAGIGLAFLAVFAAFRLHALIPGGLAFALLAGIAVLSAALAIVQEARTLVVLGIAGGFAAPILASTGQGSHVLLFAYYGVLNLGIAVVARYRSWRELNVLGFGFTFVIGAAWGVLKYRPEFFASTEPFLVGYFIFYVALAVAHARRLQEDAGPVLLVLLARDPVDAPLVFGVPLVGFGLQSQLVGDMPYGTAWSAAALAGFYALLWLGLRRRAGLELLAECFLALAIGFATVTVPLAGGAAWTASSWALEGAGLVWIGCRQDHWLGRLAGHLLICAAALLTCGMLADTPGPRWPDAAALGCVMVTAAAWLAGAVLSHARERIARDEHLVTYGMLGLGLGVWLFGGFDSIDLLVARAWQPAANVGLLAGTAVLITGLAPLLRWPALRLPVLGLGPALALLLGVTADSYSQPFANFAWLAWSLALVVQLVVLRFAGPDLPAAGRRFAHAFGVWLAAVVLVWGLTDTLSGHGVAVAWQWLGGLAMLALLLAVLRAPAFYRVWPGSHEQDAYAWLGALPIAVTLYAAAWIAPWHDSGDPRPLPYLPLVNPLDLAVAVALAALLVWLRSEYAARLRAQFELLPLAVGLVMFAWANAMLARGFHHFGVPWDPEAMLGSTSFQAGLSLLWTSVALGLMFTANRMSGRRGLRWVWTIGAGLIGATVLKLFMVDLSVASGLARIVSFIGVGLLLVAVGWFAPAPPRKAEP